MKIRTAVALMVSFLMLMAMMTYLANHGYDKIAPRLEEQKQQSEKKTSSFYKLIQKDLTDIGTHDFYRAGSIDEFLQQNFPGFDPDYHPQRPTGTWMGVRKGDENNFAIVKFSRDEYCLITKDIIRGDQIEKGSYLFDFISIEFYPDNGIPYRMEYNMPSHNAMQLFGINCSFNFERADELNLNI